MSELKSDSHEYLRFFLPLAFQSASQSLTYPLVGMVASHGYGGTLNLAGIAQSHSVSFLLGTLGAGLLTTGMVFSKNRENYQNFVSVNLKIALLIALIQTVLAVSPLSNIIFYNLLGLPENIGKPAKLTFLLTIPLHFLFFLRNPSFALLYNNRETKIAGFTTLARIVATLIIAPILVFFDLTGIFWAMVCQTIPVIGEALLAYKFSRPYYKKLPKLQSGQTYVNQNRIFSFNLPLSVGGFFLTLSGMVMGAFIARAKQPEIMLPVYYLAIGLVNPVSFAATRIQAVVLTFPPLHSKDNRTLKFGLTCGIVSGFIPLLFILPGLSHLYYVDLQNLPPENLNYIKITAVALLLQPLSVSFRSHSEGLAAHFRKPTAILAGQAVYLASVLTIAFFTLNMGAPGNLIGPLSIILANVAAAIIVRNSLNWDKLSSDIQTQKVTQSGLLQ